MNPKNYTSNDINSTPFDTVLVIKPEKQLTSPHRTNNTHVSSISQPEMQTVCKTRDLRSDVISVSSAVWTSRRTTHVAQRQQVRQMCWHVSEQHDITPRKTAVLRGTYTRPASRSSASKIKTNNIQKTQNE
jgi:hypothetical protein